MNEYLAQFDFSPPLAKLALVILALSVIVFLSAVIDTFRGPR